MEIRPLTQAERQYLKQYFGTPNPWYQVWFNYLWAISFLTICTFLILKVISKYAILPLLGMTYSAALTHYLIGLSLLIVMVGCRGWIRESLRFNAQNDQKLRNILNHNQVEIHTLHIQRAAELQEYDDEGVGFFLETNENTVLFVRGQDLYEYAMDYKVEEDEPPADNPYGQHFPSTKVTLVRENSQRIRLDLLSDGTPIDNMMRLKGKSFVAKKGKMREYIGPEDGSLYPGSLEDVLARFSIKPLA